MSSVILPTSGSMRSGVCSPRPPLVRPIDVNGSGLWPTAQACNSLQSGVDHNKVNQGHGPSLVDRALMWGTPVARDDQKSPEAHAATKARMSGGRKAATSLTAQVKMWPSPMARDCKGEGFDNTNLPNFARTWPTYGPRDPTTTTGGSDGKVLNPRFVEALMGLPNGWLTPSTSAATDSSPSAPAKPGNNSPTGSAA